MGYTVEQIVDIQERYQDIKLNFGKYKDQSLKQIIQTDKGKDYLIWLHGEMKKKEVLTPTQKAITKFIGAVFEL